MALEAELDLTLEVLATVANSTLGDILDQPLHMLRHIHSHLQACVSALGSQAMSVGSHHPYVPLCPWPSSHALLCPQLPAQPRAGARPRGHLRHWLHRLQEARDKVSVQGVTSVWGPPGAWMID